MNHTADLTDYRGMHLCETCWNGLHFLVDKDSGKKTCACNFGNCECPCSKIDQNRRDDNYVRKLIAAENKKRQLTIQAPMMTIGKI